MATVDKKILIRKKVGADIYNILPKTSSDIVTHVDNSAGSTTVAALLNSVDARFGSFSTPAGGTQNTTVMEEIAYQVNEAKKAILGVDNQSSIAAAYDTIVELANALADTEDGGQTVKGLISKVNQLVTEVETASTGLLDRTTALEKSVDGWTEGEGAGAVVHKGLLTRVSELESFTNGQTTDDVPEGNTEDRLYVNTAQKQRISDAAIVQYLPSTSTDADITSAADLYFVELA